MTERLTEEQQNEAERLVWRVMDGEHEDYIDAHAAFAAICDQADAARRFLALTETGPDYEAAAEAMVDSHAVDAITEIGGLTLGDVILAVDAALPDLTEEIE